MGRASRSALLDALAHETLAWPRWAGDGRWIRGRVRQIPTWWRGEQVNATMTEQCDSTFRRVPLAPEFRCEFFAGHPGRKHQSRGTQWMASVDFDAADTTALFRGEPPEL